MLNYHKSTPDNSSTTKFDANHHHHHHHHRNISFNDKITTNNGRDRSTNMKVNNMTNDFINLKFVDKQSNDIQKPQQQQVVKQDQQTTSTNTSSSSKVQPIWKYLNYDPNTSIYVIKKEKIENFLTSKRYLLIGEKSNCIICAYPNSDSYGTVYFTVSGTHESRCIALEQLKQETNCAGVIVSLPLTLNENGSKKAYNTNRNSLIQTSSNDFNDTNQNNNKNSNVNSNQITNSNKTITRTRSFHNKFDLNNNNLNQFNLNNNKSNNKPTNNEKSKYQQDNPLASTSLSRSATTSQLSEKLVPKRYKFDFLLQRADSKLSKEIPNKWAELNCKYPNICFYGRVISYFNPSKYESYWNKIKQMNQDVHFA